ncbi:tetratricopeptide repeat protein [Winogradskyella sp. A2]|uniref:tetratricopeptide repeat protein n=1 Tax=Winogradskyella sp. A2 TaxID=3366944 RepID=UPI00398C6E5D
MDLNKISQEEFERIEAYITGQLSDEKRVEFEKQLNDDTNFYTKVEDVKTILLGIETQALKEQLNDFHKELPIEPNEVIINESKVRFIWWRKLAIAAALIIAAGSFWFLDSSSNERLYAKYFSPDPGLPTTMSITDSYEFNNAMVLYKQGKYDDAISTWKNLLKTKVKNDTLNYFIGSALLASKKENEAIKYLNIVTELNPTTFKNDAYYYLGLAHLKAYNKEAAIDAFKQSSLPESKDLLKKLK